MLLPKIPTYFEQNNPKMALPDTSQYIPHLAYDSVVFGFSKGKLKILLMEYHATGWYALPGGFVRKAENLEDAVKRGLFERTGLKEIYLKQFHTFGDRSRYQPKVMKTILEPTATLFQKTIGCLIVFFPLPTTHSSTMKK